VSRRALGLVLGAVVAGLVLWLWPRKPKDPQQQIRALVAEIVAGAERRDLGPLSDAMADEFRGPGGASPQEVKQIVAFQVLRNQENVAVFNPSLDVTVHGDSADIEGTFLFARAKAKSVDQLDPGMVGSVYKITAALERRGSEWKFVNATYAPASWP